jgi:DNA-binding FadR family transcriptional regulator
MTLEEHGRVLERIAAHDPVGARAAMEAHLDGVARFWREHSRDKTPSETAGP